MNMLMSGGLFAPGKEKTKLTVLAVVFVILLGTFWLAGRGSKTPPRERHVRIPGTIEEIEEIEEPLQLDHMTVEGESDPVALPAPEEIVDRTGTIERDFFFKLLRTAAGMSMEQLKASSKKVPFGKFFDNPENWREKIIRVQGRIHRLVKRRTEELPVGIEVLYEAQVMGSNGYWYYVFVIEKPRLGTGDLVVFDGLFMKIYAYGNRRGTVTRAPLMVTRNFRPLRMAPITTSRKIGWVAAVVASLVAVGLVLVSGAQKRASNAIAISIERKRLDRARMWAEKQGKKKEKICTIKGDLHDEVEGA